MKSKNDEAKWWTKISFNSIMETVFTLMFFILMLLVFLALPIGLFLKSGNTPERRLERYSEVYADCVLAETVPLTVCEKLALDESGLGD